MKIGNSTWEFSMACMTFFFLCGMNSRANDSESLSKPTVCLVCGVKHSNSENTTTYPKSNPEKFRREIHLCSPGCEDKFNLAEEKNNLDPLTAKIEPRAALFQADSNKKERMGKVFYWFGYYILLGLIFGGIASYMSIQKGANAWSGFILGLLLNLVGLFIVFSKPKKETLFHSDGLTKVPKTYQGILCKDCGNTNHPSAKQCNECGNSLTSIVRSEVEVLGLKKEAS